MRSTFLALLTVTVGLTASLPASAGIDACNNIRFDGLTNCEVKLTADCSAACKVDGSFLTACAAKLFPMCKEQCTLSATPTCTDSCTTQCQTDCDNGVNVICSHNCFAECTVNRDAECKANADPAQCAATWDANCDNECDLQCVTVDGGCYQHCVECCGGSCTADANMDCQTTCQDSQWEACAQDLLSNCDADCNADGALFCDGKYIISGSQIDTCIDALAAQGIEVKAEGEVTIGPDGVDGSIKGLCSYSPSTQAPVGAPLALLGLVGWLSRRRRSGRKQG
ncbi:MAG: hypothetical protein IPK82_30780 [Polyangiaceae bacterium]|nr:hypothetical protein [Polyangiaceae bacterium]